MVTDIAVLVVAADDGVMPQTKEAIAHARAAQVPILVALNKIDKANANPDRVKQELADNGLLIEEYGGDVICVPVSAKLRRGIDDVLESILLVADIDPLMANPNGKCIGTVIESRLDKSRGTMATLLVQNGTLHVGDSIVSGEIPGKIRAMYDDKGRQIAEAPPAMPVVVLGLSDVPPAGETFSVEADERTARAIAAERQATKRAETVAAAPRALSLDTIFAQAAAGHIKELNLIVETFLNTAELRASRRQTMRLADWEGVLDTFLTSNELPRLQGAGSVSAKQAERIAHDRYDAFDKARKAAQALAVSETDELEELKRIADGAKGRKKGGRDA